MKILTVLLALTGWSAVLHAQSVSGRVVDAAGEPIIGATVLEAGTGRGTAADTDGRFALVVPAAGDLTLVISALGYAPDSLHLSAAERAGGQPLRIVLAEVGELLAEVTVTAKSDATVLREAAYAVEVVESRQFRNLSTNANDILGRVSGVNLRQSGGLGSNFTLSLNGLSGNQVRIFLNGIPMDYFGASLSLNNFSANIIERLEVYKGVVPVHLSSDALGGAINVVTDGRTANYLDASYSFGSFNTHIASLNAQYRHARSGFTARVKSFYNYSDNNYRVPIRLVDFTTGKEAKTPTWVERFHDAYESRMVWGEVGLTNTSFADQLMVGLIFSDNYKELQQPANAIGQAKIPYGEVATEEEKIIANFSYRKNGLFTDRLSVNTYGVAVMADNLSRDTASVRYDWFGQSAPRLDNTTGEVENRKTLLRLSTSNYLGNANAEYRLRDNQSLTLNYVINYLTLMGTDPYKQQNNTQFSNPSDVSKQVVAGSYTRTLLRERLKTTVFSKLYNYGIASLETDYGGQETRPFTDRQRYLGYGLSTTLQYDRWQFKGSYERATRFPEIVELFGDGLNVVPSPAITPEQSHNYNLGLIFNNRSARAPLVVSLNGFLRDAEDFIIPVVQGIKVYHINNGMVLARGVDLSAGYTYRQRWVLAVNGTYLDLRDNNPWRNGRTGTPNSLYRVRVPNVPYLFGNLSLSYRSDKLLTDADSYSVSLSQNYVHEFFYRWENLASSDKGVVPRQFTTNLELVYSLAEQRYNISAAINNLLDAEVYDNFQQLRPGRNYNVKLRYFIQ